MRIIRKGMARLRKEAQCNGCAAIIPANGVLVLHTTCADGDGIHSDVWCKDCCSWWEHWRQWQDDAWSLAEADCLEPGELLQHVDMSLCAEGL